MDEIISKVILIALFSSIMVVQSSQDNITCSTLCKIDDGNFDCWEGTENYLVDQLVNAVNNLTGLEIMIERWRKETSNPIKNISAYVDGVVDKINALGMNNGPMNATIMNRIMTFAVYEVLNWTQAQTFDIEKYLYDYYCPISCDYYKTIWMYLFICVTVVLILTLVYITVYVHRLRTHLKKRRLL